MFRIFNKTFDVFYYILLYVIYFIIFKHIHFSLLGWQPRRNRRRSKPSVVCLSEATGCGHIIH